MLPAVLIVGFTFAAILVILEISRVRKDIRFARRLRHIVSRESPDTSTVRDVARVMAASRPESGAKLIAKLFPIAIADPSDMDQLWRTWHPVHIPAYVLMATRNDPKSQRSVIESLFEGLTGSVHRVLESRRREGDGCVSWISFDEFWPVVECLEEAAVHTSPDNNDLFASRLANFATRCVDETVHAQLGWVVNELLERSPAEARLGHRIAATLASRSSAAREALNTLVEYKRIAHKTLEGDELELHKTLLGVDRITLLQDRKYHDDCETLRTKILQSQVQEKTAQIEDAIQRRASDIAEITGKGCDEILAEAGPRSGVQGVICLAAVRLVLRDLCWRLKALEKDDPIVASAIAQDTCRWLMRDAVTGKVPAFLVIESAESIRDARSGDAAKAMAAFVMSSPGTLDPGVAVCISEGIEDGLYYVDAAGAVKMLKERLADARFDRDPERRWRVPNTSPKLNDIRVFWRDAAESLQHNAIERDDMPHWMNVRLDLRRDTTAA